MKKTKRMQELAQLIRKHKALYYQGHPEISDSEYDKLEDELKKIDPHNQVLQLVGSSDVGGEKVKHDSKMLSLDKTYNLDDLLTWIGDREIVSLFKLDGVSCSLIYKDSRLSLAKTRGDGSLGENITDKIRWLESIPDHISFHEAEIRGELYCTEGNFYALSEKMVEMGLDRPTNPRNIVAGLMARKDHIELTHYLSFQAFDLIAGEQTPATEMEKIKQLKRDGFEVPEIELHKNSSTVSMRIEQARDFMSEGDYQIDGIVFTYNDTQIHNELGETAHHPRYKMAFKFQGETKTTIIKEIEWSISRNGILTPVANVEPVDLSGALISRVTLHNLGLVRQNHLRPGDEIEIVRSGEVIPKFLRLIKKGEGLESVPEICPVCGAKTIEQDIRLLCSNDDCSGKKREGLLNFIQKIGIEELSEKRLAELIDKGIVKKESDLFNLTAEDFLKLEKVKDKLANNLLEGIGKAKRISLQVFLSSLGIQGGAINKCERVVHAGFDTLEKVQAMTIEDLVQVDGFAKKSATEFVESLKRKEGTIRELIESGIEFIKEEKIETELTGKKICITGSLSEKRSVIEDRLRKAGAIVVSSVSKNTDILVSNEIDSTSSKFVNAKKFGIPIIDEPTLLGKLHGQN
jgi:DNA ligase (NAD+)